MTRPFVTVLRKTATIEPGIREFANARDGEGAVISYSFMSRVPDERHTDTIADPRQGFERYTPAERAVAAVPRGMVGGGGRDLRSCRHARRGSPVRAAPHALPGQRLRRRTDL
jgi:hypothetical protein